MLACRNTPDFRYVSLMLYGPVEPALLASARDILDTCPGRRRPRGDAIGADAMSQGRARCWSPATASADPAFTATDRVLREDIAAGLMVSGRTLLISTDDADARATGSTRCSSTRSACTC